MTESNRRQSTSAEQGVGPATVLPLFRPSAIEARRRPTETPVIELQTPHATYAACAAFAIMVALVATLVFGRLTRTVSVEGIVLPVESVTKVYVPQPGVVIRKLHGLGDRVKAGDILLIISAEVTAADSTNLLQRASTMMRQQIEDLRAMMVAESQQTRLKLSLEKQKLEDIGISLQFVDGRIQTLASSVSRDSALIPGKQSLRDSDLLTADAMQRAFGVLTTDKVSMLSSLSEKQTEAQAAHQAEAALLLLPVADAVEMARIRQQISALEVELARNEAQREFAVVARTDGMISDDTTVLGQHIDLSRPLMVISPINPQLEVQLLIPSANSGFVVRGSEVALRYAAFPYQQFGFFRGRVRQMFDVALTAEEIDVLKVPVSGSQPMFRALVTINKQTVKAFGIERPLKAGMLVTADLGEETRYLWEWMLEPILSIRGYVLDPVNSR